jgi:hypothetical protein
MRNMPVRFLISIFFIMKIPLNCLAEFISASLLDPETSSG